MVYNMTHKEELIKKLYDEKKITFEEMLLLLEKDSITTPQLIPTINPNPWVDPFYQYYQQPYVPITVCHTLGS